MKNKKAFTCVLLCIVMIIPLFVHATADAYENSESELPISADAETKNEFPDIITDEEAAKNGYIRREKALEENLNTIVLKNSDGTYTLRLYDHPVKYVDENGITQDISLSIIKGKNGSYKANNHLIDVQFSKKVKDGVSLKYNDIDIRLIPIVDKTITAEQKNDKELEYRIDENTSYNYNLTYAGFKEDIIVESYTGQTRYDFILQTSGLSVKKIEGSYYIVDEKECVKASIGDVIVFTADERNNAFGKCEVKEIEKNEKYALSIIIDEAYLKDEKTKYPICIDPTIEVAYDYVNNTGSGAIEDVTINSLDTSNGTSSALFVGKRQNYGTSRALMKFPGLQLPTCVTNESQILKAEVSIRDILCEHTPMYMYVYRFTGNTWSESDPSVGWNTVDPDNYDLSTLDYDIISYDNGYSYDPKYWYDFDITSAAQMWVNSAIDKNKGILFKAEYVIDQGTYYLHKTFGSYNRAANKPTLTVQFSALISERVYAIRNTILTDKYLTALDKDTITIQNADLNIDNNIMNGRQLWYVKSDINGTIIYNMGVKDLISYGEYEMLLCGGQTSPTVKLNPEGSVHSLWEIGISGITSSYLTIKNVDLNSYVSYSSSAETVVLTSYESYWIFEEIDRSTFNNYVAGTCRKSGNKLYVKVTLHDSVDTITSLTRNDFELVKLWNNISSNVIVYGDNDEPPSGVEIYNVTIYAEYWESTGSSITYGTTQGYKYNETLDEIPAYLYEDWDCAKIKLNSNSIISAATIKASLVHEMGHALKLQHPKDSNYIVTFDGARGAYADDNCVAANMNQKKVTSESNLKCSTPKIHDKINLINKWGA